MKLGLCTSALALAFCLACQCRKDCLPAPARVAPDSGAAFDACSSACAVLAAAACPAVAGDAGVSNCVAACTNDQGLGPASMLDPSCVIQAGPHGQALEACGVHGCAP